jgi:hypothetical protein
VADLVAVVSAVVEAASEVDLAVAVISAVEAPAEVGRPLIFAEQHGYSFY